MVHDLFGMEIKGKNSSDLKEIKKNLTKILKKGGFKRTNFQSPFSEIYTNRKIYIHISVRRPYTGYPEKMVKVTGYEDHPTENPSYQEIAEELLAYGKSIDFGRKQPKQPASAGLESRVGVFIAFLLGGVVLSFTSLGSTGHAISDVTGTTQGLAGVFLFILGLAGIAFGSRK